MGAVVPPSHWIPEDDVLLKSAVEAGASLESLAKGAVQFSRRFTFQELQDRWLSLLYDPVVSEEASEHMIALDRCTSTVQSRPNKPCGSGKRRVESIKKCYYDMCKRICNEPVNPMDISLPSDLNYSSSRDGNEPPSADFMISNSVSNNLGIRGPMFEYDIQRRSISEVATSALPFSGNGGLRHDGKIMLHKTFDPYEQSIFIPKVDREGPIFAQSKELTYDNLFEAEGLEDVGNSYSEIEGPTFHGFGCSALIPQMPIWSPSPQDISFADLPVQLAGKDDKFLFPKVGDANEAEALRCGAILNSTSETSVSCDAMRQLTPSTEDYLAELSDTFFNLTDENEILFMDTDEKDTIDKPYFDSLDTLLLNSPIETGFINVSLVDSEDDQFLDVGSTYPQGSGNKELNHCDQLRVPEDKVQCSVPEDRVPDLKIFGPEYRNGVICCVLNTEDPEIPSNDDVFLPFRFPSSSTSSDAHLRLHDSLSVDFSNTNQTMVEPPVSKSSLCDSLGPSCVIGMPQFSDMHVNHCTGDHGMKFELPKSSIQHPAIRDLSNSEFPCQISPGNECTNNLTAGFAKENAVKIEQGYESVGQCLDKISPHIDASENCQNRASNIKNEFDITAEVPKNGSLDAMSNSQKNLVSGTIDKSLMSEHEELCSDNDLDVPHYSDVEAMILDMDLSPDDFDLDNHHEVKLYQHQESKRTIIRLEQQAEACTHRDIAAHGSFALLSGCHSRHFIKKPEVLLGRTTEDVQVDIDLGREKNGGKISRRQATIKLDMHGFFHLKNLGKCSVFVNGVEVRRGETLNLNSGCLIEVRGLAFVFDTNPSRVKQYVDSITQGSVAVDQKPPAGN